MWDPQCFLFFIIGSSLKNVCPNLLWREKTLSHSLWSSCCLLHLCNFGSPDLSLSSSSFTISYGSIFSIHPSASRVPSPSPSAWIQPLYLNGSWRLNHFFSSQGKHRLFAALWNEGRAGKHWETLGPRMKGSAQVKPCSQEIILIFDDLSVF